MSPDFFQVIVSSFSSQHWYVWCLFPCGINCQTETCHEIIIFFLLKVLITDVDSNVRRVVVKDTVQSSKNWTSIVLFYPRILRIDSRGPIESSFFSSSSFCFHLVSVTFNGMKAKIASREFHSTLVSWNGIVRKKEEVDGMMTRWPLKGVLYVLYISPIPFFSSIGNRIEDKWRKRMGKDFGCNFSSRSFQYNCNRYRTTPSILVPLILFGWGKERRIVLARKDLMEKLRGENKEEGWRIWVWFISFDTNIDGIGLWIRSMKEWPAKNWEWKEKGERKEGWSEMIYNSSIYQMKLQSKEKKKEQKIVTGVDDDEYSFFSSLIFTQLLFPWNLKCLFHPVIHLSTHFSISSLIPSRHRIFLFISR